MKPNQIAKLGVVVLVIAAVAVVLRLKQADSSSSIDDPSASISSVVPVDEARTTPPAPQPEDTPSGLPLARASLPQILDLGADKCIPCKKMAPILEALREDFAGQFEVVFIDVWKNREAAGPYGIKLIPTQIFFDGDGDELFRHEGFYSRRDILTMWSDLGYVFEASEEEEPG
jgi:thioredoxin 1